MHYLLLVSGAAFVAAGAVLAAEARVIAPGLPIPRRALALLGVFALTNGLNEWADMAVDIEVLVRGAPPPALVAVHVALVAASFALLLAFAVAARGAGQPHVALGRAIAVAVAVGWAGALAGWLLSHPGASLAGAHGPIEALTRWVLGLPAAVCATAGLLALARSLEAERFTLARLVRGAGWILLVYGVLAAATVVPDKLHPSWPFAPGELGAGFAIGAEVVRALCGAAIAVLLSEAFVFQTSQRLRREETHLRDDFVALVTHELGNPVAALELAAERLEASRGAARPVDAGLSSDVRACALTLRRILMDLLDTSRIHARQLEVSRAPTALRPLLDRAAATIAALDRAGRRVEVSCPADLVVSADPARLDQILRNLLSNAAKYSRPGTPVTVEAVPGPAAVTIRVSNEGPRIAPREASRVFSLHYRASKATGGVGGLGIGLYVARGLVEAHGGRIWIDGDDPRTAFCFTLPCAPAPRADAADARDEAATGVS